MKDKKQLITAMILYFALALFLLWLANFAEGLTQERKDYQQKLLYLQTKIAFFEMAPTATPTPTPTATPSPTPTNSPTPTPIALMSNQEYYNECVARGLVTPANDYDDRITKERGGYMGPSGRETYYNLKMDNCVAYMRELGFDEILFPYWVRDDGAKMLGNYVMCAANWKTRPRGTLLETSLGTAIVVDTGEFVADYPNGVDLAVDW